MNINMKLDKQELNTIFEVLLKNALANNVTLNLNIDLKDCGTPVKTVPRQEKHIPVVKEDLPTVTLGKCTSCGCVQAVNLVDDETPKCYNCHEEMSTDLREFKHTCDCGSKIYVNIVGTGVAYVSCNECNKRYLIKMDYDNNTWIVK